ncbi:2-hydroxyacid dehydrogenase [Nocardioides sp.]|jgi:phosphoglycerate dehydrogenase-like enzyme|uniref:2-hydroxyacid dehydrogenase n=1 Tax=Nocardioides sp. TaxID=35761 RepID=UPI002D08AD0B|nr:2-hydroxyacid dehydrogenase [Nocardioides sp.]HVX53657.1 2-hydroxyacid dehydrogenase [Nocardioides sp.]
MSRLVWVPFDPAELGEVPAGLRFETIDPTKDEVPASVADVEVYVPPYHMSPSVADVLPRMTSLRVIQTLSAGVDSIRARVPEGVVLCNGRGIHDTSTAELTVALTLASLREVPRYVRQQDRGEWRRGFTQSLADKRVLIVGYGAIGAAIESRLTPFECEVVRVARTARDGVHAVAQLPELLPDADVVVLILPLTEESRGLVDEGFLARMKQGALLVNMARGAIVDTGALVEALHAHRVRAALDVVDPEPLPADHPLWHAPGVLISPHNGGASSAMRPRAMRLVREQLERYVAGRPLINVMTGAY